MAVYDASLVRAVALELQQRVFTLYTDLLPIYIEGVQEWTLNGLDPALPAPFNVRAQLEAYDAMLKPALRLTEWIAALKEAQPSDVLTYPPPPEQGLGVYFDETLIFDENLIF